MRACGGENASPSRYPSKVTHTSFTLPHPYVLSLISTPVLIETLCALFQITGQLFQEERPTGLDLIALNMQRGRDHGLATYLEVRQACGFPSVSSFEDLSSYIDPEPLMKLEEAYR